jgi:hypothetical protein
MVKSKRQPKEKNDFWEAIHDIRKLATQRMDSKARRKFQEEEAKRMGAKVKKNPKIPYNIYQGILKKEKEIKQKAKEDFQLSRDCNYFNPVTKRKEKFRPRNPQPTTAKVGKYQHGTLFIKKPSFSNDSSKKFSKNR